MGDKAWISILEKLPHKEDYHKLKFGDGTVDFKPFRIRLSKNIIGFMSEEVVTHWR